MRSQISRVLGVAWAALCLASSGCNLMQGLNNHLAYNDQTNDFVLGWRNSVWAQQAWHARRGQFADHPQVHAFGAGFRDGFANVAGGGNGCPPALPPRKYWSWKYQNAEGQCKVAAWFEGYPYGAQAAEEDGANAFQQIQVSYAIETQYSPEFQAGQIPVGAGMYYSAGEGDLEPLMGEPAAGPQFDEPVPPPPPGYGDTTWHDNRWPDQPTVHALHMVPQPASGLEQFGHPAAESAGPDSARRLPLGNPGAPPGAAAGFFRPLPTGERSP